MSRQLGMPLGSAIGFMLTAQIISFISIFVLSVVYTIGSVGLFFQPTSATFLGLALPGNQVGATPLAQLIVGGVIFTVLIILNTVAPKASYKIISVLVLVGIASVVLAIGVLLSAGNTGVINYMNSLGNSNMTYNALASSYSGPTFDLGNTMMLMPFFFLFIFPFMNAAAISGSELKGKSAAKWSSLAGELIALVLTAGSFATLYYVSGQAFINAAFSNPTAVFTYGINFWTLAMGAANNLAIAWILGICWIIWNLAVVMVTIVVVARYVFAEAFDRWLPSKLAYASHWGSPLYANLLNLIVGLALVAATVFLYGPLSSLTGLVIAPMLFFLFVAISAVLYGHRHEKGRNKAVLMIAGTLMTIVFAYISALTASLSSIYGQSTFTHTFLIVTCVIGIALYYAYKAYYKARGLDISLVYKEIPPL